MTYKRRLSISLIIESDKGYTAFVDKLNEACYDWEPAKRWEIRDGVAGGRRLRYGYKP